MNELFKKITEKNFNSYIDDEFFLYFRNKNEKTIEVKIKLFDINKPLNRKWFNSLREIINNNTSICLKKFSLLSETESVSEENIFSHLLNTISIIRNIDYFNKFIFLNESKNVNSLTIDFLEKIKNFYETVTNDNVFEKLKEKEKMLIYELPFFYDILKVIMNNRNKIEKEFYFYFNICDIIDNFKEINSLEISKFSNTIENGMVYLYFSNILKKYEKNDLLPISGEFFFYLGENKISEEDIKYSIFNKKNIYYPIGKIISVDNIETSNFLDCQKKLYHYDDFYGIKLKNEENKFFEYKSDTLLYYNKIYNAINSWKK